MATQKATLIVRGMHCKSCVSRVERALSQVPGVTAATVDLAGEQAAVEYMPDRTDENALRQAVRSLGYQVPD